MSLHVHLLLLQMCVICQRKWAHVMQSFPPTSSMPPLVGVTCLTMVAVEGMATGSPPERNAGESVPRKEVGGFSLSLSVSLLQFCFH